MSSSGVGGVYPGPGGQQLYGDGREVNPVRVERPSLFEQRMAKRAVEALKRVTCLERELDEARAILRTAQQNCPHLRTTKHERASAETDPWTECLDCGGATDGDR